ncbi:MAG: signal peptidase I [Ruminococcus sp.]|nr:signal peptidase I [Ruminococcus sp.]
MKKIANILSTLLIVVLIIALAAVLVSKLVFGVEMKAVLTGSMEPELPVGSLLIISPAEYEDINIGDDITFVRDKNLTLVTHRVIEKDDETQKITTQGIANNSADKPTSYGNVVGKVAFHIPFAGYFVIWTSDLKGKIICGIIIVALVALSILFSNSEPEKNSPEENDEQQDG